MKSNILLGFMSVLLLLAAYQTITIIGLKKQLENKSVNIQFSGGMKLYKPEKDSEAFANRKLYETNFPSEKGRGVYYNIEDLSSYIHNYYKLINKFAAFAASKPTSDMTWKLGFYWIHKKDTDGTMKLNFYAIPTLVDTTKNLVYDYFNPNYYSYYHKTGSTPPNMNTSKDDSDDDNAYNAGNMFP
jgi:hypothetical protein